MFVGLSRSSRILRSVSASLGSRIYGICAPFYELPQHPEGGERDAQSLQTLLTFDAPQLQHLNKHSEKLDRREGCDGSLTPSRDRVMKKHDSSSDIIRRSTIPDLWLLNVPIGWAVEKVFQSRTTPLSLPVARMLSRLLSSKQDAP